MRNVLIGLGILLVLLIGGGVAFYHFASQGGSQMDATSRAYVDEAVPAIVSTWSKDELIKRITPQLLEQISDKIAPTFSQLGAELGPYQSYDGATGQAFPHFSLRQMKMTASASYVANASFRDGKIEMKLFLLWDDDHWVIVGFGIKPKS